MLSKGSIAVIVGLGQCAAVAGAKLCPARDGAIPFAEAGCKTLLRASDRVTLSLFGSEARAKESWCGRGDWHPHRPCGPTDFLAICSFRRRLPAFVVWTIPSPCSGVVPGFRCCPSSLYTFLAGFVRQAWLGIARSKVPPNLSSSASPVSRRALKFRSSPVRLPIPPRPRGGTACSYIS